MTKTCTLRIIDEANCAFLGLSDNHIAMLVEKYGIFARDHFFNPKFKLGMWDGKLHYFSAAGKTYNFLIEEIVPIVMRAGYKINIDDKRTASVIFPDHIKADIFAHKNHPDTGKPIALRTDQVNAVNCLLDKGTGICLAATGAGKTLMTAAVCTVYGAHGIRTLTIVPDQTLIRQTKQTFELLDLNPGEYSGDLKTPEKQHVVSTWQALKNNPSVIKTFDLVIVDEAHGLRGDVLKEILIKHSSHIAYRFGFTGTLPKHASDKMCVHIATGPVRVEITADYLMSIGALASLHIDIATLVEDMTEEYAQYLDEPCFGKHKTYVQFKDSYFPDFSSEKSYLQRNVTRIQWIAQFLEAKRDSKKGNVLCLVDSIPFGRKLAEQIPGAIFVNGQDTKKVSDRTKVYDLFAEHDDLIVIATVNIAGTGLSINRIFNLVTIDIGKAFTRVMQAIGRGLRTASDKNSVIVTDICSDLKYSKKHIRERKNYYDEAKYKYKQHKINYTKTVD